MSIFLQNAQDPLHLSERAPGIHSEIIQICCVTQLALDQLNVALIHQVGNLSVIQECHRGYPFIVVHVL